MSFALIRVSVGKSTAVAEDKLKGDLRMNAVEQKQTQRIFIEEIRVQTIDAMNCYEVRENLDGLFDQESSLEETPAGIKRKLFSHLETCRDCCRTFDVRVRFRPASRAPIY